MEWKYKSFLYWIFKISDTEDEIKSLNRLKREYKIFREELTDIISCVENELLSAKDIDNNIIKRIVSLRNYFDMTLLNGSVEYSILSSLLHLRNTPNNKDGSSISEKDEIEGMIKIKAIIKNFEYKEIYNNLNNIAFLKNIYETGDPLDKIFVIRILLNIKPEFKNNKVLWKCLSENFHSENTYFYKLNNSKFKTIPSYIIDSCNDLINKF